MERQHRAWLAILAVVIALAGLVRFRGFGRLFVGSELMPQSPDEADHMRRILLTAEQFPHAPFFDPLLAWPRGGMIHFPPLFDQICAAVYLAVANFTEPAFGMTAVGLLPPLVGLYLVAAVPTLQARFAGQRDPAVMVIVAFAVAVLPVAAADGIFGAIDHHAAETWICVGLAAWSVRGVEEGGWRHELAGAALASVACLVWQGSFLYVGIAAVALVAGRPGDGQPRGAPGLLAGALLTGLATVPMVAEHGHAFSYAYPSYLQPVGLLAAAGICALPWFSRRPAPLLAGVGLVLVIVAAAVALATDAVGQAWEGAVGWLLRRDLRAAGSAESLPFFASWRLWEPRAWRLPRLLVGDAVVLWLGGALAAGVLLVRRRHPRDRTLLVWLAFMGLLVLLQSRFLRAAYPTLLVAVGVGLQHLWRAWALPRRLAVGASACLALLVVDPVLRHQLFAGHPRFELHPAIATALFLREVAPPIEAGDQGVVTQWDLGAFMLHPGGRPVVAAGYNVHPNPRAFDALQAFFVTEEDEAVGWMERHDHGWVVVGRESFPGLVLDAGVVPDNEVIAAVPMGALLFGGSGDPAAAIEHIERLLPRHAAQAGQGALPHLWVYERVPGAVLAGEGTPGAEVVVQTALSTLQWQGTWRAWGQVDGEGTWELRIPVFNGALGPSVRTGEQMELRIGETAASVVVGEDDVRQGRRVEVTPQNEPPGVAPESAD